MKIVGKSLRDTRMEIYVDPNLVLVQRTCYDLVRDTHWWTIFIYDNAYKVDEAQAQLIIKAQTR